MSTLSEHQANGKTRETRPQSADTAGEIRAVLQTFDVLSSKVDKYIFKYGYLYLIGFLLLNLLSLLIPFPPVKSASYFPYGLSFIVAIVVACLILWIFNVWRERVPQTLRDIFENDRIYTPAADCASQYLEFLKKYRGALRNPIKYLLSAVLMLFVPIYFFYIFLSYLRADLSHLVFSLQILISGILFYLSLLTIVIALLGFMYCLGISWWSLYISGQYLRNMSRTFEFRIEPVHPDNCGGLSELGNICFDSISPLLISSAFYIGWILVAALFRYFNIATIAAGSFLILIALVVAIFSFLRPLWSIHTKMLHERKTDAEHYVANIAPLREKIQWLLDANQLDEAKTMKEKKELMEALYIPYPTWPFHVKSKLFQTAIGASGSLLAGMVTGLGLPLVKAMLHLS